MFESVIGSQFTIALFAALLIAAATTDVMSYRIPNIVVIAILSLYPIFVVFSPSAVQWAISIAIFAAALAVGFALFAAGLLGAGDAKLLAAVMLWSGPQLALLVVLVCTLAGGLLALVMMSPVRTILASGLASIGRQSASEAVLSKKMPYGVPIALGGLVAAWSLLSNTLLAAAI